MIPFGCLLTPSLPLSFFPPSFSFFFVLSILLVFFQLGTTEMASQTAAPAGQQGPVPAHVAAVQAACRFPIPGLLSATT